MLAGCSKSASKTSQSRITVATDSTNNGFSFYIIGCFAWTRTKISGFKGRCPAIRRQSNKFGYRGRTRTFNLRVQSPTGCQLPPLCNKYCSNTLTYCAKLVKHYLEYQWVFKEVCPYPLNIGVFLKWKRLHYQTNSLNSLLVQFGRGRLKP